MVKRLSIQNWENFSDREKEYIKELITISLKARELRLALLSNSSDNLSDEGFEIVSKGVDAEAKSLDEVLPRVGAFLSERSKAINTLEALSKDCEKACNTQYHDDKELREKCKKGCKDKRLALAEILSLGSFT